MFASAGKMKFDGEEKATTAGPI